MKRTKMVTLRFCSDKVWPTGHVLLALTTRNW